MKITDKCKEYESLLKYIRVNLAERKNRPKKCATDDLLIQHIDNILSKEGMTRAVETRKWCEELLDFLDLE